MARDHVCTASPNAGWTMSAAAGALNLTLEKLNHYRLGVGRSPNASDIDRSLHLLGRAAMIALVAATAVRLSI
jgi:adenosylcobinamide-phosphate synthase